MISTLRYTAQGKSLLGTGSRIPTTDERVGSRSRRVGPCQCGVVRFRGVVMKVRATISRVYITPFPQIARPRAEKIEKHMKKAKETVFWKECEE